MLFNPNGWELNRMNEETSGNLPQISQPLWIIHGEADRIAYQEGSVTLAAMASSQVKNLRVYPGAYHELVHDSCAQQVTEELIQYK
jgi:alpha-beta hydrolase superfamily lysophospholipase